jgi:hypothetical protein
MRLCVENSYCFTHLFENNILAEIATLEKLHPAEKAQYNHIDRPMCLTGTRTSLLREIAEWMDDPDARQVYWLNGAAGTGKSSIAQSVSQMAAINGKLGASFFGSRDSADRSNMDRIFPTIAFQLSYRYSQTRAKVVAAINSQAVDTVPIEQFRQLIIEPLQVVTSAGPIIMIIDALDECKDVNAPEKILLALAQHIVAVPTLRIFVASRPAFSAQSTFRNKFPEQLRSIFILHQVERRLVNEDIRLYINFQFQELAHDSDALDLTSTPWPPPGVIP